MACNRVRAMRTGWACGSPLPRMAPSTSSRTIKPERSRALPAIPTPDNLLARAGRQLAWETWKKAFETPWHVDQVSQKRVRPYQQMAIYETMFRFAAGLTRVLLLMATGTGKTFTVFQLIWKLINGNVLANNHILFLTDRNNLQDQAWRAFSAFASDERVVIDKEVVRKGEHQVGKIFFANYQNLDEELDGKKLFEHYSRDFFDLVIVDECHRSGFGDWFPIFQHFDQAFQLGLTATPREIEDIGRPLSAEEQRRDTYCILHGFAQRGAGLYLFLEAGDRRRLSCAVPAGRAADQPRREWLRCAGRHELHHIQFRARHPPAGKDEGHRGRPMGAVRQAGASRRKGHRLLRR